MRHLMFAILLSLLPCNTYAEYVFSKQCDLNGKLRVLELKPVETGDALKYRAIILSNTISISCENGDQFCVPADNIDTVLLNIDDAGKEIFDDNIDGYAYVSGTLYKASSGSSFHGVFIRVNNIVGQNVPRKKNNKSYAIKQQKTPNSNVNTTRVDSDNSNTNSISNEYNVAIAFALAVIGVIFLVAGAFKRVVIYYDTKDALISFAAGVFLFFAYTVINMKIEITPSTSFGGKLFMWSTVGIYCLCTIASVYYVFRYAYIHNRSALLALFIGAYKIMFIMFTALVIAAQTMKALEKKSSKDIALAALIISLFGFLTKIMINGQEVYEAKGWQLPSTDVA